jgi:ankyrin repeat protein
MDGGKTVDKDYWIRPIENACELNLPVIAEILLRYGVDPNGEDPQGAFPLILTSLENAREAAEVLLKYGADIDKQTEYWNGRTALINAMATKHNDFAKFLLDHHANPNLTDSEGNTALHEVSAWTAKVWWNDDKNPYIVKALIEHHAEIDRENDAGETPLYLAIKKKVNPVILALLTHGANLDYISSCSDIPTPRSIINRSVFGEYINTNRIKNYN